MAKILHVTQSTGGVETSLLLLFRHLDRTRFELHLACPPDTVLATAAAALGVRVFPVPMVRNVHPWRDLAALISLVRLMRRERYDLVHAHSAKGGYLARMAAWLTGTHPVLYAPRAFSYLSQRGGPRSFFLALERLARPITDVLVAASESERRRAIEEVGFAPTRVTVIPNGVDLSELTKVAARTAGATASAPTVLMVARLSYQKNPGMFVRVAARVAAKYPSARFILSGGGFASPEEGRVRLAIARAGLAACCDVLPWGSKQDTLGRIAACDVFVLTSRFEGMPNTVLEAMALGRPVVATDVDGTRDVVRNGQTGVLVPVDADSAMADAIVRLLAEPALAARYGAAGAALAAEQFDVGITARRVEEVYQRCLDGHAPARRRSSDARTHSQPGRAR